MAGHGVVRRASRVVGLPAVGPPQLSPVPAGDWCQARLRRGRIRRHRCQPLRRRLHAGHFAMDLEFLLRRTSTWREITQGILFTEGDIVAHGEQSEEQAD